MSEAEARGSAGDLRGSAPVTGSASRRREWALALGVGLLVLLIRAPLVDLPLERDEGEYAYIAWRLEHGELPYRDWFDQKPPGIFLAYRLALAAPGDPVEAIRGLAALVCAGSAVALYFLARRLLPAPAAALASLLLAWTSADPGLQGPIANTELFMLPWLILANLAFLEAVRSVGSRALPALLAGAFVGVAASFKQVAAVDAALFVLLFPLLATGPRRLVRLARFVGWATLGGVAVWLPILAWFLLRGGLEALLDAVLLHNLAYVAGPTTAERLQNLAFAANALWSAAWGACLLAGVGFASLLQERERWRALYLGAWLVASAVGVSASGQYFVHYFQQLLPALAIGAAAGALALYRATHLQWIPAGLRAAALAAVALAQPMLDVSALWRLSAAEAIARMYPSNPFEVMPAIADEIAALTDPEDTVFVYGAEAELFFYAQRRSASRYIFLFPLFGRYDDALARQKSVIEEIRRERPAVIVKVATAQFFGPSVEQELTFWLADHVEANYRHHAVVVAEPGSRGRVLRMADGSAGHGALEKPWAHIFVRREPELPTYSR